jgi:dienelactone hydrolase
MRFLCAAVLAIIATSAFAAQPERVDIPAAPYSSSPAPLVGHLYTPESGKPRAAIVMMHGCGGAYARNGALNSRHRMWGEYLAGLGYAALMVDSFTSRGLREICTIRLSERPIKEAGRVGDAYAALAYVRSHLGVERVGLIGWSHGGGTVLDTMAHAPSGAPRFDAAVSFYPGCRLRARRAAEYHPYAPVLLLIGESDDWTPAAPRKALVSQVAARGEPMQIVTYPDSYHDFDNPGLKGPRVRKEVPNGANPGRGVTIAPNAEAREDAKQRVQAFFEKNLEVGARLENREAEPGVRTGG